MIMKKIVIITFSTLLVLFVHGQSEHVQRSREDKSEFVKSFYQAYITCLDDTDSIKQDSLLTQYCSTMLKDVVLRSLEKADYDFILDGWGGSDINPDSVKVNNLGEGKYNVLFKVYRHIKKDWIAVNLWVIVSDDLRANAKIEQVIRQSDNYAVPSSIK